MINLKVHVLDNFLLDPEGERARALEGTYKTIGHNALTYRGISLCEDLDNQARIANYLGHSGAGKWEVFWRRYLKSEKNETYIHNDCIIGQYTCILFLNTPEQCKGGTAFWMHKLYKWFMNPSIGDMDCLGLRDTPEFFRALLQDGFDESKWEMIDYVPMQFNRLIIFPSSRFHSRYPQEAFGDDTESGRLIKVFFYQPEVAVEG